MLRYRLILEPDDNGTILVTSPDFPIVTYGADEKSAWHHAIDATESLLASMMEAHEDIQVPDIADDDASPVLRLSLQTTLKVELYRALRAAGLTQADFQKKLGWRRESVDHLFRLDRASKIEQFDEAFRALGKEVSIDVRDVSGSARIAA